MCVCMTNIRINFTYCHSQMSGQSPVSATFSSSTLQPLLCLSFNPCVPHDWCCFSPRGSFPRVLMVSVEAAWTWIRYYICPPCSSLKMRCWAMVSRGTVCNQSHLLHCIWWCFMSCAASPPTFVPKQLNILFKCLWFENINIGQH